MKIHSTNTLERLNKEVKRRADVVGIFSNDESITRLLGAVLTEHVGGFQWNSLERKKDLSVLFSVGCRLQ